MSVNSVVTDLEDVSTYVSICCVFCASLTTAIPLPTNYENFKDLDNYPAGLV